MVNIDGLGRIRTGATANGSRAGRATPGGFAKLVDSAAQPSGATRASSVGGIEALLAAQEAGDGTHGGSRGKARAEALLDSLDELRSDILAGAISPARLHRISDLVATQRGAES